MNGFKLFLCTDGYSNYQDNFWRFFNPLVHSVQYIGRLTKILILEGILEKISYQRRVYESVDEMILS